MNITNSRIKSMCPKKQTIFFVLIIHVYIIYNKNRYAELMMVRYQMKCYKDHFVMVVLFVFRFEDDRQHTLMQVLTWMMRSKGCKQGKWWAAATVPWVPRKTSNLHTVIRHIHKDRHLLVAPSTIRTPKCRPHDRKHLPTVVLSKCGCMYYIC